MKVAPDLAFEILSPTTSRIDKKQKKRIYERNEILEYVLVDAATETFQVLHLEAGAYGSGLLSAGDTFASRVLPGFEIAVAEVFFGD